MHYESFLAGFITALFVIACVWLYRTLQIDPVPQIPETPKRKPGRPRGLRKPKIDAGMGAGMTPPESAASTTV